MSTVEQQRRPNGPAAITGVVLLIVGLILLFNGVPGLFGAIGTTAQWVAFSDLDRALTVNGLYLLLYGALTLAGLLMVRGGFRMLRKQGKKGAQWAQSEWQQHGGEVQQRVQSAREQLQSQGQGMRQQVQQRAQQQRPQQGWSPQQQAAANQQQRQGWPGQPPQGQWQGQNAQQRQPAPPQPRTQQQPARPQSTLERMQQRMAEATSATDRARDAALAKHEEQAEALRQRAERAAAHAAFAEPGSSFGAPELVAGRRASSILSSSSLRSSSLRSTSLSLDSLRLRR